MSKDTTFTDKPIEGKITDEGIAALKSLIGSKMRSPEQYLRDATVDTINNFSNGIGDMNPLYRHQEYGRWSRYGSIIAHPCFPYVHHWPGRTRWGLPGVHGFYAGNDWEFFRFVRPGDRINCVERIVGVEEKASKFSGRLVMQYVEDTFTNQRNEIIAIAVGWCTRHERQAAREQGKYKDIQKEYQYTSDQLDEIEDICLNEVNTIRGNQTRYWEDTQVGEELPPIIRGPLSLMDTMGWIAGCGRSHTHGILLQQAVKHPNHFFRNPEAGGGIEYTGIGHHRESVAQEVGVPGTYDYGPQRTSWMATVVTNWMGDDGFIKRLRGEMRRFNIMGDTTWVRGKVTNKYKKNVYALVDLEVWTENQRKEVTSPGLATVVLPSKDLTTKLMIDGSQLELGLPCPR